MKDKDNKLLMASTEEFLKEYWKKYLPRDEYEKKVKSIEKRLSTLRERFSRAEKTMKACGGVIPAVCDTERRLKWLEDTTYTKADHAGFMEIMDEAMQELRDAREDRVLNSEHISRLNEASADHEKRICVLER